jgi:hypothetical protein
MQQIIKNVDITKVLPGSVAPHSVINEVRIIINRSSYEMLLPTFLVSQYLEDAPCIRRTNISIDSRII